MVVPGGRHGHAQQRLVVVDGLYHGAQEQKELGVLIRGIAGVEEVHARIRLYGPVVVFAAAVDAVERFLVEQAHHSVFPRDLLHYLHRQLIVVGSDVRSLEYRRQLMLGRSGFVVLCLGQHAQLPELLVELGHEGLYLGLYGAEIVIVQFLPLGRAGAEQRAAGIYQILAAVIKLLTDEEVFLLGTGGGLYGRHALVPEKAQHTHRLFVEGFHGPQERSLLVEGLSAVGAERRWYVQRVVLDERAGGRIPRRIASRLECRAKTARGET